MMIRLLLCLLAFVVAGSAATRIRDTIYSADGKPAAGTIRVEWPSFTTTTGRAVPAGFVEKTVTNGVIDFDLEPTDTASPSGIAYVVRFVWSTRTAQTMEYWTVPTSATPVKRSACWSASPPSPSFLIALSQLSSTGSTSGNCLLSSGSGTAPYWGTCGGGGGGVADPGANGLMKRTALNVTAPAVSGTDFAPPTSGSALLKGNGAGGFSAATAGTDYQSPITLPLSVANGGAGVSLAATGGTGQVVKQSTTGGNLTVGALTAAEVPALDAAKITTGTFPIARLASGTPDGTKFVRDDGTLAVPAGGSGLADPGSNGLVARTGSGTSTARTLTAGSSAISVTNGNGVSGNPTVDVGSTVVRTDQANTFTAGKQDASGASATLPYQVGTLAAIPATCTQGQAYFATDGITGRKTYTCTATNIWVPIAYDQGSSNPATCAVGQTFFNSSSAAGRNWWLCTATNTWTQVGGNELLTCGTAGGLVASTTSFFCAPGYSYGADVNRRVVVGQPGTITTMVCGLLGTTAATGTLTLTLVKNGTDTAITGAFPTGSANPIKITGTVSVLDTDYISIKGANTSTSSQPAAVCQITITY